MSVGKTDNNEWVAKNIDVPGGFHSKYDVYHNGEFVATVHLSVPGEHNVLNSLCAFAAAYESGADVKSICEGLMHLRAQAGALNLSANITVLPLQMIMLTIQRNLRLHLKQR